jgi:hypothetical protein
MMRQAAFERVFLHQKPTEKKLIFGKTLLDRKGAQLRRTRRYRKVAPLAAPFLPIQKSFSTFNPGTPTIHSK